MVNSFYFMYSHANHKSSEGQTFDDDFSLNARLWAYFWSKKKKILTTLENPQLGIMHRPIPALFSTTYWRQTRCKRRSRDKQDN